MGKIICVELLLDEEKYKEIEGEYAAETERLKAIAIGNDLAAIREIKNNMEVSDSHSSLMSSNSEYEMMEELLRYQDVDDFFEARAEYMVAAVLAGIEPYEYVYDEAEIDDLLDDIIDTTELLNEVNMDKRSNNYVNETVLKALKQKGLAPAGKTYEGKRKEICVMTFVGKEIGLKISSMPEKMILETDSDNEEAFEKIYDFLKEFFEGNHIVVKREAYKV